MKELGKNKSTIERTYPHIIGWGLAGATLAWQMHFRNQKFVVHDSGVNYSSRVAAGLVNPIVFKRLTKTWNVDILLPVAKEFYTKISKHLGVNLMSKKNIYYPFTSTEDENNWSVRIGDDRYLDYLEHTALDSIKNIHAPFGFGKVNTIGNLNTNLFLDNSKKFFLEKEIEFINENADPELLIKNDKADYIFCEGINVIRNPLFNYLPMKSSHGETLTIQTDELEFDHIISKNLFILPLGKNQFKIGSTYNWDLKEPIITESGKADLIERFETLFKGNYTIISHGAGVRPTVSDRRPLLGVHLKHNNAFIFNGLGTKGVLLAPYYAAHFLDFLKGQTPLENEINITRFQKRYANS